MADSDKNLKVKITTEGDTAGAKKVIETLGELNKDNTELSEKTEKLIEKIKEEKEEMDKLGLSHRNVRELGHNLLGNLGELTNVLNELDKPTVAAALAFSVLFNRIQETNAQLQEMVSRPGPDWEGSKAEVEALSSAYDKVTESAIKFQTELEEIERKKQSEQSLADRKIAQLKESASIQEQLSKKEKDLEEAALEEAEKNGLISHSQYLNLKYQLDELYAKKRLALEAQLDQQINYQRQQELERDKYGQHVARGNLGSAQADAAAASGELDRNKTNIETQKGNLEKALKEREKLQEDIADLQNQVNHGDSADVGLWILKHLGASVQTPADALKILNDRYEGNENSISLLQTSIERAKEKTPELTRLASEAESKLNEVETRLKAYTNRIIELEVLLPAQQASAAAQSGKRTAEAGLDSAIGATHLAGAADAHSKMALDLTNLVTDLVIGMQGLHATAKSHQTTAEKLKHDISQLQQDAQDQAARTDRLRNTLPRF